MEKLRVLLADHHTIFREGLKRILAEESDIDCVGSVRDSLEAVTLASEAMPDVLLFDIDLPPMGHVEFVEQIKGSCPSTDLLILTHHKCDHCVLSCIQAGVRGYLSKEVSISNLISAIRMVHDGETVFDASATDYLMSSLASIRDDPTKLHARERQVLMLAAKGMGNKAIARKLGISASTVATHFFNIFKKLQVQSRTEAVLYALKHHLISLNSP